MLKQLNKEASKNDKTGEQLLNVATKLIGEGNSEDRELLKTLGLDKALRAQEKVTGDIITKKKLSEKNNKPVFTLKEILNVGEKYHLSFRQGRHYAGNLPSTLLSNLKSLPDYKNYDSEDIFILAPPTLFDDVSVEKLKVFPEFQLDPVCFVRNTQDKDKFILVDEWGKDFTLIRRLRGIFYQKKFVRFVESLQNTMIIFFSIIFFCIFFKLFSGSNLLINIENSGQPSKLIDFVTGGAEGFILGLIFITLKYFIFSFIYGTLTSDNWSRNIFEPRESSVTSRNYW